MEKQNVLVKYGQNAVNISDTVKDRNTVVYHLPLGSQTACIYVAADSTLCKLLEENDKFKEVEYTNRRFCKFETRLQVERMVEVLKGCTVRLIAADPASPKRSLKKLLGY
jgi:hypothetical protein